MSTLIKEEDVFQRPSSAEIRDAWQSIFSDPLISLGRLKAAALSKDGLGQVGSDGGVTLRSVYWRFYHNLLPPPTSLDLFPHALETSRAGYDALRRRYLVAPDGRWAADCSGYEDYTSAGPSRPSNSTSISTSTDASRAGGGGEWDPLSLSGSNPWKTWFTHVDLRSTILQDVERTFPDLRYFQLERVKKSLTTSLFLYAILNPDVGYRQGMHELLACCFLAVDRDSLDHDHVAANDGGADVAMRATLDRRFVEHDAFELFASIMKSAKTFYEWRAEEGTPRTRTPSAAPQAPIIVRCNNLHMSLIRRIDPQLWEHLENEGVEAQIWAIRWIRLIFTRELPFPIAMRIWDGVFAEDPGLGLLDFICVAMLLLIRNELINADYPSLLTNLLHYPSPSLGYPFEPFLILSQALFLRNSISPASGVEVVIQNQELLGIKATPPECDEEPVGRLRQPGTKGRGGSQPISRSRTPKGVGGLAQGLFERAQAAGLDKAILSTVADFRKNLPDSTTAYSYLPNLPFSPLGSPGNRDGSFSTIPNNISALPSRSTYLSSPPALAARPDIQSRLSIDSQASEKTVKDAEREVAELRLAMVGMGKAMNEWLGSLRPVADEVTAVDKETAWQGLERVQNSLLDAGGKEVEEIVREWAWHDGLEAPRSRATTPAVTLDEVTNHAPLPVSQSSAVGQPPRPPSVDSALSNPLSADERTPTAPQVDVLLITPTLPTPHDDRRSSSANLPSRNTPVLHLSSRDDKPATSLPRVPMTAPQSTFPRSTPLERARPRSSEEADPLAGLGVSVRKEEGKKYTGNGLNGSAAQGKAAVDPLLGLGVR